MAEQIARHLAVLPREDGETYLSWRLLAEDDRTEPFRVERSSGGDWSRISDAPIVDSTDFVDRTPEPGVYDCRVVDGSGMPSEAFGLPKI